MPALAEITSEVRVAPPKFKFYLERVVACGPHPSEDHDVVVFESGHYVEGAANVDPGELAVWVTREDDKTIGVFQARVRDNEVLIRKFMRLSPLLIHAMSHERERREAEFLTIPDEISLEDAIVPVAKMEVSEEIIKQMPKPKRL